MNSHTGGSTHAPNTMYKTFKQRCENSSLEPYGLNISTVWTAAASLHTLLITWRDDSVRRKSERASIGDAFIFFSFGPPGPRNAYWPDLLFSFLSLIPFFSCSFFFCVFFFTDDADCFVGALCKQIIKYQRKSINAANESVGSRSVQTATQ